MREDSERESESKYEDIAKWCWLIGDSSPPDIGTDDAREEMGCEWEKWTKNPSRKWDMSLEKIEQILNPDKSKDNKYSEYDNISSGEGKIMTHKTYTHEMLRWLLDSRWDEEWSDTESDDRTSWKDAR